MAFQFVLLSVELHAIPGPRFWESIRAIRDSRFCESLSGPHPQASAKVNSSLERYFHLLI